MAWIQQGARSHRLRFARSALLAVVLTIVVAAVAYAGTDTITNGYYDYNGALGPRHSLTRVFVHDYGGPYWACEDALNSPEGTWAQAYPLCVSSAETWHDFCACHYRLGWNGAEYAGGYELMTGHQDW